MANPQLNKEQQIKASKLIDQIRESIITLADNNPELIFAFNRKVSKMLVYDERSSPYERRKLKKIMRLKQHNICPICSKELPSTYSVLDRNEALKGYTEDNVKLICEDCDRKIQKERGYK